MSIAVMNWVWASSPTSGNERLVLLALADSCSRDDGTGCFPSAREIARKARISERSVPRVIARLEAGGHVTVHRGGGRVSNRYTVLMVARSPGRGVTADPRQPVTGDKTSGVTPVTGQGCHQWRGSPDTIVSADPPGNHQGTAATCARGSVPGTGGGRPGRRPDTKPGPAPGTGRADSHPALPPAAPREVGDFFAALGPGWPLTGRQQARLAPAVAAALTAGWSPSALAAFTGANTGGVRSPYAVLASRLSPGELPVPSSSAPSRPPWCGACDQGTRMLDYDGDAPRPCPRCKPGRRHAASPAPGTAPATAAGPPAAAVAGVDGTAETAVSASPRPKGGSPGPGQRAGGMPGPGTLAALPQVPAGHRC